MTKNSMGMVSKPGRMLRAVTAGAVLALGGAAALSVSAMPGAAGHGDMERSMMGGSPQRMDRVVDRMLESVNATEAQRTQVKQILQAAASDLKAQRDSGRALHEQRMKAFTAPTVDANAVEALRQQMLPQHDQETKRMSQAMIEISRVLTPEQRTKLAERMQERSARMHDHRDRAEREQPRR